MALGPEVWQTPYVRACLAQTVARINQELAESGSSAPFLPIGNTSDWDANESGIILNGFEKGREKFLENKDPFPPFK